ncbi:Heavy metal-associated isoprenylated plant protein 3 [Sesamum alatum]|uniref:Heavy metal-associated isoprenylated plant protein 3 n=1 Tax=Sesamum alatum TaxID=300844 RepID=A0AAE2CS35_9LAMI|nr:Heavy metal-associated isoprenylated plant protein 3 [Sesamum alatum]
MGEKVETKNEAEKKAEEGGEKAAADGGGKTDEGPITVVLKLDLHCEGCAKKVRRSVSHFEGVEKVKAECEAKKLTVTGNVDPAWLRERVETKTKKKVELISPQPRKDAGGGGAADKKAEEKPEKKITEEKKADETEKPKEAAVSTVVMKIKLHCDGCANKIKRVILKNVNGAHTVTTDLQKHLVTVIGTIDVNELITYLKEKLKRGVEIVPPKKDDHASNQDGGDQKEKGGGGEEKKEEEGGKSGGGGEKKDEEGGKSGGGDKKDDELKPASGGGGGGNEGTRVEVNKMEYHSFNPHTHYAMPMYNQTSYANQDYGHMPVYHYQGYPNTGYVVQYAHGPPPPPPTYLHMNDNTNDHMFSDENPNGCFVM